MKLSTKSLTELLEQMLQQLKDGDWTPFSDAERAIVSLAYGYFPAWEQAMLYETYGISPLDTLGKLKEHGLRVDWKGFQYEMAKRGADISGLVREGQKEEQLVRSSK